MRYAIYKIEPYISYGITISPREKPDSEFRERIVSQIDKAMSSLKRLPEQTHKIAIIPEETISESNGALSPMEPGIPGIPYLKPNSQYLIFAIRYSSNPDTAELEDFRELESYKEELERMYRELLDSVRIGLILLQDCSVYVIETSRGLETPPRSSTQERLLAKVQRSRL